MGEEGDIPSPSLCSIPHAGHRVLDTREGFTLMRLLLVTLPCPMGRLLTACEGSQEAEFEAGVAEDMDRSGQEPERKG